MSTKINVNQGPAAGNAGAS